MAATTYPLENGTRHLSIATLVSVVIIATGLLSGCAHDQTYQVKSDHTSSDFNTGAWAFSENAGYNSTCWRILTTEDRCPPTIEQVAPQDPQGNAWGEEPFESIGPPDPHEFDPIPPPSTPSHKPIEASQDNRTIRQGWPSPAQRDGRSDQILPMRPADENSPSARLPNAAFGGNQTGGLSSYRSDKAPNRWIEWDRPPHPFGQELQKSPAPMGE